MVPSLSAPESIRDVKQVVGLMDDLIWKRHMKVRDGLRKITPTTTVKMNNLSPMELNRVRPLGCGIMDMVHFASLCLLRLISFTVSTTQRKIWSVTPLIAVVL